MNALKTLLQSDRTNLLSLFFTAGHPKPNDIERIIVDCDRLNVDFLEVGMPYSDPLADGPTIQKSSSIAITNGMTLDTYFKTLEGLKDKIDIPLIFMGYFNQALAYGFDKFCMSCKKAGISGLILPDLPAEMYDSTYKDSIKQNNLVISFLITPQTSIERIQYIDSICTGFIYVVSDSSITGTKTGLKDNQIDYFKKIKALNLKSPCIIGFGISDKNSFNTACTYSKGAIIGSAFIKHLEKHNDVESFVKSIRM